MYAHVDGTRERPSLFCFAFFFFGFNLFRFLFSCKLLKSIGPVANVCNGTKHGIVTIQSVIVDCRQEKSNSSMVLTIEQIKD